MIPKITTQGILKFIKILTSYIKKILFFILKIEKRKCVPFHHVDNFFFHLYIPFSMPWKFIFSLMNPF